MDINVAFKGSDEAEIVASFSCRQDEEVWEFQGTVSDDDPRWIHYAKQFPSTLELVSY